jgi:hypothetical protein
MATAKKSAVHISCRFGSSLLGLLQNLLFCNPFLNPFWQLFWGHVVRLNRVNLPLLPPCAGFIRQKKVDESFRLVQSLFNKRSHCLSPFLSNEPGTGDFVFKYDCFSDFQPHLRFCFHFGFSYSYTHEVLESSHVLFMKNSIDAIPKNQPCFSSWLHCKIPLQKIPLVEKHHWKPN